MTQRLDTHRAGRAGRAPDALPLVTALTALTALAALAGCTRAPAPNATARSANESPAETRSETAAAPASTDDAPGAAARQAPPAPPDPPPVVPEGEGEDEDEDEDARRPAPRVYASLAELLGLDAAEPGDALAGYKLGDSAGTGHRNIVVLDFGGGYLSGLRKDAGGVIRHVTFELSPGKPDPESRSGVDYDHEWDGTSEAVRAAIAKIKARWGKPRRSHGRLVWKGRRSQLIVTEYHGGLRGTSSLVIDLLPAGENHVCGARDGFRRYFERFRKTLRAVGKDDVAALTALIDPHPEREMSACITLTGSELVECVVDVAAGLSKSKAPLLCNVSTESWYWSSERDMGGLYIGFGRDDQGKWRASGPWAIDHAGGPEETSASP